MDDATLGGILARCEGALAEGGRADLGSLGFWKVVSAAKRDPRIASRHGERIARIDRDAFVRRALVAVPAWAGVALEALGAAVGAAVVAVAPVLGPPWRELALLAGCGALIGMTHALTHYVVGGLMGMRFTHFFSWSLRRPQPGFKTDYATYLRTPARSRAWMHASGAIASKAVPFLVAALAVAGGAQAWAVYALLGLGLLQLVTDVTLSTRKSDWKRFRREMRFAR